MDYPQSGLAIHIKDRPEAILVLTCVSTACQAAEQMPSRFRIGQLRHTKRTLGARDPLFCHAPHGFDAMC